MTKTKLQKHTKPGIEPPNMGAPPSSVLHNRLVDSVRGTHRVVVYAAGSRGLAGFARTQGLTAFKLGVTSAGNVMRRIVDLRRKQYGALFGRPEAPVESLRAIEQAEEWALVPWVTEHLGANPELPPGFYLRQGVLEIEIRLDVPVETVDRAVHAMMAPRALDAYLATDEGRARLMTAGYDPDGAMLTAYTLMFEEVRLSRVREIYLFRPQVELRRLVACLATVLAPLMPVGDQAAEAA